MVDKQLDMLNMPSGCEDSNGFVLHMRCLLVMPYRRVDSDGPTVHGTSQRAQNH